MRRQKLAMGLIAGLLGSCSDATQFTNTGAGVTGNAPPAPVPTESVVYEGDATEAESSQEARRVEDLNETVFAPSPEGTSNAAQQLEQRCSEKTPKILTQSILFPETKNCRFSQAGNLGRRDAHLQAMEAQLSKITLPVGAALCGLSLSSAQSTIQYDDFLILTLNGHVLLSSNQGLMQGLQKSSDQAYLWDFSRIKGQAVDFASPAYCLGAQSSSCTVPVTDTPGQFSLQISPADLKPFAENILANREISFSLIATGDNDDEDCYHTAFSLDFALEYVD